MAREQLSVREFHRFASRGELVQALAARVAGVLGLAVAERGSGLLAVSGGNTPGPFFDELAKKPLDWGSITVTLVDERLVPPGSERSNARLARERLLVGAAGAARFVPLYEESGSPEQAAALAEAALSGLPWPLDAAVLGMGADGHTASFFPGAGNLGALLDANGQARVLPVRAPGAPEPRLTLTLAALAEAGFLALHIDGEEKAAVLDRVIRGTEDLPIGAVLDHARVEVFWAP